MTVSQSIADWLKKYNLDIVKVDVDSVGASSDSFGLFKTPDRTRKEYICDDSYELTETYIFYARQGSQTQGERLGNDEWWENFTYWVDDCNVDGILPIMDNNRECLEISVSGNPYVFETADNASESLYQASIQIHYIRKIERNRELW
ncbi:hypothetical protein ACTQ6A_14250 [Lachnospiraceae bacterium LCP25S3_G4]